jgi:hypothetical protein
MFLVARRNDRSESVLLMLVAVHYDVFTMCSCIHIAYYFTRC